jgi:hypothetical protein
MSILDPQFLTGVFAWHDDQYSDDAFPPATFRVSLENKRSIMWLPSESTMMSKFSYLLYFEEFIVTVTRKHIHSAAKN